MDDITMTPAQLDRVFGRGRLQMATGEHVEVFREAVGPGERRRYTKRFLNTRDGNFAHWTEREWRILARLIGHGVDCVPDVVQFDRGSVGGTQLVQTYDAGATVDQWATLLPLIRGSRVYRHAFEDCAHWWALAHHALIALKKIHHLELVHLDVKGDNVCVPFGPSTFDPDAPDARIHPVFDQLALIDFAFALVSGEALACPLPIGWQRDYDYQSPRLLKALEDGRNGDLRLTCELDWRCDMYSLAAMLKRYLPDEGMVHRTAETGWSAERYDAAKALILSLREHHDRDAPHGLPHAALINTTGARLRERDLAASLAAGWTLARDIDVVPTSAAPLTPMTRLAPSIRVFVSPHERIARSGADFDGREIASPLIIPKREDAVARNARRASPRLPLAVASAIVVAFGAASVLSPDHSRAALDRALAWVDQVRSRATTGAPASEPSQPADKPMTSSTPVAEVTPVAKAPPVAETMPAAPIPAAAPTPPTPEKAVAAANPEVASEPPAPPVPVATSPVRTEPQVASALPPPVASKKALVPSKIASSSSKKAKGNAAPALAAQSPRTTAPSIATQRAVPTAIPNKHVASSVKVAPPVSSAAASGASHAPTRSETSPMIAANAPATTVSTPVTTALVASPPVVPMPSVESADQSNPTDPERIDEMPAPSQPSPSRERSRKSLGEKIADQGWLSRLLQIVKSKPAPIEDRRAQASAPKNSVTESTQPSSRAQQRAQTEPSRSAPQSSAKIATAPLPDRMASPPPPAVRDDPRMTPQPDAWQAVELPGRISPPVDASMAPSAPEASANSPFVDGDSVFAHEGRRVLRDVVPRVATQAQTEIARVLWVAANANDRSEDRTVVDAVQSIRVVDGGPSVSPRIAPAEARRLNAEASDAFWSGRNTAETLDLQLKAFGANPYDAEIVGNLAVLHLKHSRSQAETARQLAMIAIAYRSGRYRTGRVEDWTTYAIASALTGRQADARNAFFVTVALSPSIERSCRSALTALSNYGERLREPVEALFYRVNAQGRAHESTYCSLPRKWAMAPTSGRVVDDR